MKYSGFERIQQLVAERKAKNPDAKGVTKQTYCLLPKIREADSLLRHQQNLQDWVVEVHPEVSFRALAMADLSKKKSAAGKRERLKLLSNEFEEVEEKVQTREWLMRNVAMDDRLDAYVALWSALRFRNDPGATQLLGGGERDDEGLQMRMVV